MQPLPVLPRRRRLAVQRSSATVGVALVIAGVALGGCGSGSTSDSTTATGTGSSSGTTLDRAALAAKANAVCGASLQRQLDLLGSVSMSDPSSMNRVMTKVHALWQNMDREFSGLTPDAQAKAQWVAFVAAVRQVGGLYGQSEAAIKAGDATRNAQLLTPLQASAKRFGAAATALGATACAAPA